MMSAVSNALPRTSVVPASSELDTVCSGSNPKSSWAAVRLKMAGLAVCGGACSWLQSRVARGGWRREVAGTQVRERWRRGRVVRVGLARAARGAGGVDADIVLMLIWC